MRRSQLEIDSLGAIILAGGGGVALAILGLTEESWHRVRHGVSTAIEQLGCRPKWLQA